MLYYLHDFVTAGLSDSPHCAQNLSIGLLVCDRLGLPLHPEKCVGPTPVIAVLSIELGSLAHVAHLPEGKLQALKELIHSWLPQKWCFWRELESLFGHFHHAAKVVWPGQTFLRHMIDLISCFRKKDHPIRLGGGPQRFHPSCNSSAVCCSLRHAVASPFQLNTSQMSTIKSLMLFLVSVGRNFDGWPQPIPLQLLSELTTCL